ncbi:MAG: MBL fold metallo-hydrolase [Clostridia bacterium]|nr:MBL fold metallo-hydrolase [Clostridia bacterium]
MRLSISPLFSGSSGNSTYIGTKSTGILVDAGLTGTAIESALKYIGKRPEELKGIIVTHEHSDHIKGVGVLSRKYDIPVYATAATWEAMNIGDVSLKNARVIDENDFFIGDMTITPVPLSHDAADPHGFTVSAYGKGVAVLTDSGKVTRAMIDAVCRSTIVLLEANHDIEMLKCGRYPYHLKTRILSAHGHLSNDDSGIAAGELVKRGVKGIILSHLSRDNNFPELALETVKSALADEGIRAGRDVSLKVAERNTVTGYYEL